MHDVDGFSIGMGLKKEFKTNLKLLTLRHSQYCDVIDVHFVVITFGLIFKTTGPQT